jgi:hypothetical protein
MSRVPREIILHAPPLALLTLLLTLLISREGSPGVRAGVGAIAPAPNACSLTSRQERVAMDAFDKMLPVLYHNRCFNCHGGVNPYVDPAIGRHLGGAQVDASGAALPDAACEDCHGLLPGWQVPGVPMHFTGRSPADLCMQFKQFAPGGGADFVEHIEHELGSPQFIKTAFLGNRALNTLGEVTYEAATGRPPVAEPPPGTLADLVALARTWTNAIGAGWTEDPECGCVMGGAWHGTITGTGTFVGAGFPGKLLITSHANVMLEPVPTPSYASGNRVRVYHPTGGHVSWSALPLGGCVGNAGGSFRLDSLHPGEEPLVELRLEDVGRGRTSYRPSTASWEERWSPYFTLLCEVSGTRYTLPMTNLLSTWWHYDIPNPPESTNPDRLQGSYVMIPSPGSMMRWEWDLKRVR